MGCRREGEGEVVVAGWGWRGWRERGEGGRESKKGDANGVIDYETQLVDDPPFLEMANSEGRILSLKII